MLVSLVIPVYKSEKSLETLCTKIDYVFKNTNLEYEIIFVDDNSKDNSFNIIRSLSEKNPKIRGYTLKRNYGQQNAIFCGLQKAVGDYIVTMDDDLQHNPKHIPVLINKLIDGYDLAYGIFPHKEENLLRIIGAKMRDFIFNCIFPSKPKHIRVSSFRAFSKNLKEKIIDCPYSFIYISALMLNKNPKVCNVNFNYEKRLHGQSGYNLKKLIKIYLKLFIYYYPLSCLNLFREKGDQFEIQISQEKENNDTGSRKTSA
ncbi:glycosyltransferase family 2 protein [Anaeromicrobium sediminis]|uniref:Glycosyltransferase 2-like domain-containing protein n=1 Tax=Anaeromicrobium sediminis TaxID=1478221 RepID=A0A267MKT4_9FIRM|nr:glycosyltransferase family 2 protein [Anaeromicrobium sediminis]PAB60027.1 hypothetical protein CCE28_06530 [Anaeromicrobium sediminis]